MDERLQGVLLAIVLLGFLNSAVLLLVSISTMFVVTRLYTACHDLKAFLRRRFTEVVDKI